jgi:hypothetical protein
MMPEIKEKIHHYLVQNQGSPFTSRTFMNSMDSSEVKPSSDTIEASLREMVRDGMLNASHYDGELIYYLNATWEELDQYMNQEEMKIPFSVKATQEAFSIKKEEEWGFHAVEVKRGELEERLLKGIRDKKKIIVRDLRFVIGILVILIIVFFLVNPLFLGLFFLVIAHYIGG